MMNKKIIIGVVAIILVVIVAIILVINYKPVNTVVSLFCGKELVSECGDSSYIDNSSTHIIEGIIKQVKERWNDDSTEKILHADFLIEKYVKGASLPNNEIQIAVFDNSICSVKFVEGKRFRVHLREYEWDNKTMYDIVCSQLGIEEI